MTRIRHHSGSGSLGAPTHISRERARWPQRTYKPCPHCGAGSNWPCKDAYGRVLQKVHEERPGRKRYG